MGLRNNALILISIVIATLLVACGNDTDSWEANEDFVEEPLYMLSPDGVGPLNAGTPFNLRRLGDAFQDYNVTEETRTQGDESYSLITIKQRDRLLLSINPTYQRDHIFSVVIHDNRIGNKLGHRLGDRFNEVYSYGKTEACAPGMDEWSGHVLCYAPGHRNILYVFQGEGEVQNQAPPPEEMADWLLRAIIWKTSGR